MRFYFNITNNYTDKEQDGFFTIKPFINRLICDNKIINDLLYEVTDFFIALKTYEIDEDAEFDYGNNEEYHIYIAREE